MAGNLSVDLGGVSARNPYIAAAGEHLATAGGIRAALAAGAGVVVAKSINETEAAKDQLDRADYVLLDERWRQIPWGEAVPASAQIFCRSGLARVAPEAWAEMLGGLDREAAALGSYVGGSIVLADLDAGVRIARMFEAAGLRLVELNIGAPYASEAKAGTITTERDADRVTHLVKTMRAAIEVPLWVKLTGQSENVAGLAKAARDAGADAVILMGRALGFVPCLETHAPVLGTNGSFGGPSSLAFTCHWLARSRKLLGPSVPLIGTSGARDGLDIVRMMLAGASAVGLCTAVMTGGFAAIGRGIEELRAHLVEKNLDAQDIVGRAADRLQTFQEQPQRPGWWENFVPVESRP